MQYQISEASNLGESVGTTSFQGTLTEAKLFAESHRKSRGSTLRIHNNVGELIAWKIGKHRWKFTNWS